MFQTILNFVSGNPGNTISLHFAAGQGQGRLEVSIIPEAKVGSLVPQVLVESVDVLNAEFSAFLVTYLQTNQTLAERLATIKASADALAKQAEAQAASNAAGGGKKKASTRGEAVAGVIPARSAGQDVDLDDDGEGGSDGPSSTSSPVASSAAEGTVASSAAAGTAQLGFDL